MLQPILMADIHATLMHLFTEVYVKVLAYKLPDHFCSRDAASCDLSCLDCRGTILGTSIHGRFHSITTWPGAGIGCWLAYCTFTTSCRVWTTETDCRYDVNLSSAMHFSNRIVKLRKYFAGSAASLYQASWLGAYIPAGSPFSVLQKWVIVL